MSEAQANGARNTWQASCDHCPENPGPYCEGAFSAEVTVAQATITLVAGAFPQAALERLGAPPAGFKAVGEQFPVEAEEFEVINQPVGDAPVQVLDRGWRELEAPGRLFRLLSCKVARAQAPGRLPGSFEPMQ